MSKNETAEAIIIVLKKFAKWGLAVLLILSFAFFLFFCYEKINQYLDDRPKVINELKGIKLGDKQSDFLFRNAGFELYKDEINTLSNVINYANKELSIYVSIKDKVVYDVVYGCIGNYDSTHVNGIFCRSSGDLIIDTFGKDLRILCLKDKSLKLASSYRVYDTVKYGVRYHVISNAVHSFQIVSPSDFFKEYEGVNWIDCE